MLQKIHDAHKREKYTVTINEANESETRKTAVIISTTFRYVLTDVYWCPKTDPESSGYDMVNDCTEECNPLVVFWEKASKYVSTGDFRIIE